MSKVVQMPAARRINRGKGHSYTLDGQPVMGVTTAIKKGLPMPALSGWAARECAEFVAGRRDILTQLNDAELMDLVKGAPNRVRNQAAERGTEVHSLAQRLARGDEVEVPEELNGHIDHYLAFLDAFRPARAIVERPVFNRRFRYGGTLDMLAETPDMGWTLFDVKTSGSGIYGDIALQLAAYGHAEFYVDEDNAEVPLPDVDSYVAVWVRGDGYDVYPVDVTEREWIVFQSVLQVAWWAEQRQEQVVGAAIWRREEVKS